LHERRHIAVLCILTVAQAFNHAVLILFRPVLAELAFADQAFDFEPKADNALELRCYEAFRRI